MIVDNFDRLRLFIDSSWRPASASYPLRSGLPVTQPSKDDWQKVYRSAVSLVRSGAVSGVLKASYEGLFVDEYQDCVSSQHDIICALAPHFPTCVFGDHLQAIFDFKGQKPVDWEADVFPVFSKCQELSTPWRWDNAGNREMADWLGDVRGNLENGYGLDLSHRPGCVHWVQIPPSSQSQEDVGERQRLIAAAFRSVEVGDDQRMVVIVDSANAGSRVRLARRFAKFGCSNIEPIDCRDLINLSSNLGGASGLPRLEAALEFAAACMTGTDKSDLLKSVISHLDGGKLGAKKFGEIIPLCMEVTYSEAPQPLIALLTALKTRTETHTYRRAMFYSLCAALKLMTTGQFANLTDAVWQPRIAFATAAGSLASETLAARYS